MECYLGGLSHLESGVFFIEVKVNHFIIIF